jgi:hypothetical protein
MPTAKFQATLTSGHKEDAVEVPFDPGERWTTSPQSLWPGRRGYPVKATLNGTAFEGAIVSRAKRFWLLVPKAVEKSTGTVAGDLATITIAPDNEIKPTPHQVT